MQSKSILTVEWDRVKSITEELAEKLEDRQWEGIVCVTAGGLMPTYLVSKALNIPLIKTFCIKSYQEQTLMNESKVFHEPDLNNNGKGWLVIDGLTDSGRTFEVIRQKLPEAFYVALYVKPKSKHLADLHGEIVPQDQWIEFPWEKMASEK